MTLAASAGNARAQTRTNAATAAPARDGIHGKQIVAYFTEWGIYGKNYLLTLHGD